MKSTSNTAVRTGIRSVERPVAAFHPRVFPGGPLLSAAEFQKKVDGSEVRRREMAKTMNPGQRHLEEKVLQGRARGCAPHTASVTVCSLRMK